MLHSIFLIVGGCIFSTSVFSQRIINGTITDSITGQHLSFSSIHVLDSKTGFIADINGRFSIKVISENELLSFSYTGYNLNTIMAGDLKDNSTILLSRRSAQLKEVVVSSNSNKIRRIINSAIQNKASHNPDNYLKYECNIYYKMNINVLNFPPDSLIRDSSKQKNKKNITRRKTKSDSLLLKADTVHEPIPDFLTEKSFLMLSETFSKRIYKKPQQVQEIILASRFSGLKKTYFSNIITDVLPFHVYNDFIKLNNVDYTNPISKGWQNKYHFILEDQINSAQDTIYVLSFEPKKNVIFNSLRGTVYISKNSYAISHMIGSTADTSKDRLISFEQVYSHIKNVWFPKELNYTFTIKKIFSPQTVIVANGHSIIDSVKFTGPFFHQIDHAHPVIFSDSIDLRTDKEWANYRLDSLSGKELNTYKVIDSFSEKNHLEKIITLSTKLNLNKFPIGKFDVDINRLIRSNEYEDLRVGMGLYTNNKISRYYSIGGWGAYGFKDKKLKGGASATFFPGGNKDNWLTFAVQHDYRKSGMVNLFEDLNKKNGLNWVLRQPDVITEYKISAQSQIGYTEINPELIKVNLTASPFNDFISKGNTYRSFSSREANVGIRYAYGEKRIPVLDYYIPLETKFPILYLRFGMGDISSTDYNAKYFKALGALTYSYHINRWGLDAFRAEGGWIKEMNSNVLPRSFLFATNGIRLKSFSYYFPDGFVTMSPNLYFSDKYFNLFYSHTFDKYLWETKNSKPSISVMNNISYGSLLKSSVIANPGIVSYSKPYNETGLMINQLIKYNVHITDVTLNTGVFYHWSETPSLKKNTTIVFSVGVGF